VIRRDKIACRARNAEEAAMARVFITGSSDGLGLMAARLLIEQGYKVVVQD
jgi:NAD(P)-dependent dehydrogenase (short-subunit alcohol dehydrogenase family)